MKIKLLKKLRKRAIRKVYIRFPIPPWRGYEIITPLEEDPILIGFYTNEAVKNARRELINERRRYILEMVFLIRKLHTKKYYNKELNKINKLIP